jgi:pyruvate dehydrogenase (quinone)
MTTIAEQIIATLADLGVRNVWGVVGDALNPVTDAIRREERIEWIGTGTRRPRLRRRRAGPADRHLGVCMGTVGPGAIHLLNGLYDAKKSHAPVLAVCGQVPLAESGSDYFQEVDNDAVFSDVAEFCHTITSPSQFPRLLEQAIQAAYAGPGVAVLTLPGDVGLDGRPEGQRGAHQHPPTRADPASGRPRPGGHADQRGRNGDDAGRHGRP